MDSLRNINMQLRNGNGDDDCDQDYNRETNNRSDSYNNYSHAKEQPAYRSRPGSSKIKVRFIPSSGPAFSVLLHTKPSVGDVFLLNNVYHHVVRVERMLFQPDNSMVREGRIHVYTYVGPPEETESGQ